MVRYSEFGATGSFPDFLAVGDVQRVGLCVALFNGLTTAGIEFLSGKDTPTAHRQAQLRALCRKGPLQLAGLSIQADDGLAEVAHQ